MKNQTINTILFDVDGTLINSDEAMMGSIQRMLKEELGRDYSFDDLRFTKGIPTTSTLAHFDFPKSEYPRLMQSVDNHIDELIDTEKLYPEIEEMLAELSQHVRLGIITSKTDQEMANEFPQFGITDYFDLIVTASDTDKHKPDPAPLRYALDHLDEDVDNAIYIGDTKYDLQTAHSAGMRFALAGWGTELTPELQQSDWVLDDPHALVDLAQENK